MQNHDAPARWLTLNLPPLRTSVPYSHVRPFCAPPNARQLALEALEHASDPDDPSSRDIMRSMRHAQRILDQPMPTREAAFWTLLRDLCPDMDRRGFAAAMLKNAPSKVVMEAADTVPQWALAPVVRALATYENDAYELFADLFWLAIISGYGAHELHAQAEVHARQARLGSREVMTSWCMRGENQGQRNKYEYFGPDDVIEAYRAGTGSTAEIAAGLFWWGSREVAEAIHLEQYPRITPDTKVVSIKMKFHNFTYCEDLFDYVFVPLHPPGPHEMRVLPIEGYRFTHTG